jgi:hypothetical protein
MRAAFDKLLSWMGVVLGVVLLVAGGLLTWGSIFVANEVQAQFEIQDITMPSGAALDSLPPEDKAALEPYAGQQMLTGPQAKAYADHFILVHMNEGGEALQQTVTDMGVDTSAWVQPITYSSAGAYNNAVKNDASLSDDVKTQATTAIGDFRTNTLFTGNTLRGLLLYGYAFATIGTIAGYAAIAAFVGAAVLLLLAFLGLWHARRAQQSAPPAAVLEPTLATA